MCLRSANIIRLREANIPYLRQEPDNSLAETLGNLGSSLGNALNPMNQLRAYDIQQQMFLRRQQLEQMQRENNAKQAAINTYSRLVPPDKLPIISNMILQGAPQDQVMRQAAMLSGQLIDKTDPASIQHNIRFIEESTGQKWTDPYPPYAGETTGAYIRQKQAEQAGAVSGQQALGTKTGEQAATGALIAGAIDDTTPEATKNNTAIVEKITGKPWDQPYAPPITPKTIAAFNDWKVQNAGATAEAAAGGTQRGENQFKPRDLSKPQLNPPSGGFQDTAAPTPVAGSNLPVSTPPAPAVTVPNSAAPFAPPVTVSRGTPVGTITGSLPSETATNDATNKARADALTQAMDAGAAATTMKVKLNQLQGLEEYARTGGFAGQVGMSAAKALSDRFGVTIGTQAQARAAMDQIVSTELPALRQAMGIKFYAGPEIQAAQRQLGSATLPPEVFNNILASENAVADLQIERRADAQRTLGLGDQPMSFADFTNADNARNARLQGLTDKYRTQLGAIGTETQQPAPVAQPVAPLGGNTVLDAIHGALGWLTGGSQTPSPQAPPAPDASEPPVMWDPKTQSVVPVPGGQ